MTNPRHAQGSGASASLPAGGWGGRLWRRATRAGSLARLALDLASLRSRQGAEAGRARRLQAVVDRLGLLHGLPQKIGQLLASSDLEEHDPRFAPLTEAPMTLPQAEAFSEMERQLGRPLRDCFSWVDPVGISASVGQVHRATLLDGRPVAVKIQYPGIAEGLEQDLGALGWLTTPVGGLGRGFDLEAYRREIGRMLHSELDYTLEASRLRDFGTWAADWPDLLLPKVVGRASGPRILTTTWVPGDRIAATRSWASSERRAAASTLLRFFLSGVFRWGTIHADPHPGNYRFLRDEDGTVQVGVLDFGCVKELPPGFIEGFRGLLRDSLRQGAPAAGRAWGWFLTMGFNPVLLAPMRDRLPAIAGILCEPFLRPGVLISATDWRPGDRLASLLGPDRLGFRIAAPPELLYLMRVLHGLLRQLVTLAVPLDWGGIACASGLHGEPAAGDPSTAAAPVPAAPHTPQPSMKSDTLHIHVTERGRTKVALSFGAGATDHLPDLVPVELRDRLRLRSIDLSQIAADARLRDYEPGELFSLEEGPKAVRVWLA